MASWNRALKEGLLAGSVASGLSALTLAALARRESQTLNAPDLRQTLASYLMHHATSVLWATLYSGVYGQRPLAHRATHALPASAVASTLAYFVDHQLTPQRLQTGFAKGLSAPAMVAVYGSFAIGLAAGSLLLAEQERQAQSGERRRATDRRQRPRRSNDITPDRRRWRAGQPAVMGEGAQTWPWPEASSGRSGSGDGGTGESWSATVTSR